MVQWWHSVVAWVETTYGVNPYIFIFWYVLSIPIYWWGLFYIAKGTYKAIKGRSLKKWQTIAKGLIVNRIAWIMPYAYAMLSAKKLPSIIWVFLGIMLTLSTSYFTYQIFKGKAYQKLPQFLKARVKEN